MVRDDERDGLVEIGRGKLHGASTAVGRHDHAGHHEIADRGIEPGVEHGSIDRHQLGLHPEIAGQLKRHLDVEADQLAAPVDECVRQAVLEVADAQHVRRSRTRSRTDVVTARHGRHRLAAVKTRAVPRSRSSPMPVSITSLS